MRLLYILVTAASIGACTASSVARVRPEVLPGAPTASSCSARDSVQSLEWQISDEADAVELSRWCNAVGVPVLFSPDYSSAPPQLDELVVMSWNAHLAEGELDQLIDKLKEGAFTDGRPVGHFVLLIQELYRRGDAVPAFDSRYRSAHAIRPRDPEALDIDDHAASLGLTVLYVPSMRNGPDLREDRGNAIISTEPLLDPYAIELPLARQRRVALGASVPVLTADGVKRLEVVDTHLEPLSSPKTMWIFRNPRGQQVRALMRVLDSPRFTDRTQTAGVVLGGDFNTIRGGAREEAYRLAREWSSGFDHEDRRNTHKMGRLDYLFFRLPDGWSASTRRLDERFGSDHNPVLGVFSR